MSLDILTMLDDREIEPAEAQCAINAVLAVIFDIGCDEKSLDNAMQLLQITTDQVIDTLSDEGWIWDEDKQDIGDIAIEWNTDGQKAN